MAANVPAEVLGMFNSTQEGLRNVRSSNILPDPLGGAGLRELQVNVIGVEAEPVNELSYYQPKTNSRGTVQCPAVAIQFEYEVPEDVLNEHPALENTFKGSKIFLPMVRWSEFMNMITDFEGVGKSSGKPYNRAEIDAQQAFRRYKSAASSILGIPMTDVDDSSLQEISELLTGDASIPVTLNIEPDGKKYKIETMAPPAS